MPDKTSNLSVVEQILLGDENHRDIFLYGHCTPYQEFLDDWYEQSYDKKFTDDFTENWIEFLKSKTEGVGKEKAEKILGEAYNLASSVNCTIMEKYAREPSKTAPVITPYSEFRKNLGYDDSDFHILRGTLNNAPSVERFDKLESVYQCLDSMLD